jgi:hypothetical protein
MRVHGALQKRHLGGLGCRRHGVAVATASCCRAIRRPTTTIQHTVKAVVICCPGRTAADHAILEHRRGGSGLPHAVSAHPEAGAVVRVVGDNGVRRFARREA